MQNMLYMLVSDIDLGKETPVVAKQIDGMQHLAW